MTALTRRRLPAALVAALLTAAPAAGHQSGDPVGWPRRDGAGDSDEGDGSAAARAESKKPKTKSATAENETTAAEAAPDAAPIPGAAPSWPRPAPGGPRASGTPPATGEQPGPAIGALERYALPITPLRFVYAKERRAMTRAEASALKDLAERLRTEPARVTITAYAADGAGGNREALRLPLARALAVRALLVREGVAASDITVSVLAHAKAGAEKARLEIAPAEAAGAAAARK